MSRTAIMYVTERCNQACVFCLEEDGTALRPDVPRERVQQDLETLRAAGAEHITFMGGETFLRKDLPELLVAAKKLGFTRLGVTTNGSVIAHDGFLPRMVDAGLDFVEISVHADTAELAAEISGKGFTWERQERALTQLEDVRERLVTLIVNVVVCRENAARLAAIVGGLAERHPRLDPVVKFKFVSFIGAASADSAPLRYADVDVGPAIAVAEAFGWRTWLYNFPLCRVAGHEAESHDAQAIVLDWRYHDYDHRRRDGYHDTGHQLEGNVYPAPCTRCSLAPLCPGLEETYRRVAGESELVPSASDPVPIVRDILQGAGGDASRASAVVERLRSRPRAATLATEFVPRPGEAAVVFRHAELGDLLFEVGAVRVGVPSFWSGQHWRLAYRKPARDPGSDARGRALLDAIVTVASATDRAGDAIEAVVAKLASVAVPGWTHLATRAGPPPPDARAPLAIRVPRSTSTASDRR